MKKCGVHVYAHITTNELVMLGAYTTLFHSIPNLYYAQLPSSYHLATKLTRLSCINQK